MLRKRNACCSVVVGLVCVLTVAAATGVQRPANSRTRKGQTSKPKALKPGDVDPNKSRVYVFVGKTGFGHEHGVEARILKGSIDLGAESEAGELVFDMKSFVADTAAARKYLKLEGLTPADTQRKVTANMRGPDVLDVGKYPTARFRIDSAKRLAPRPARSKRSRKQDPAYQLDGKFTLHGVSRPLRVVAVLTGARDGKLHLRGRFILKQTRFGMTPYSTALGAIGVSDDLTVWGDLWVVQKTTQSTAKRSARRQ